MKDGKCPKCGSTDVFVDANIFKNYYGAVAVTLWKMGMTDNYVCTACGCLERYVQDPQTLRGIAQSWLRPSQLQGYKRPNRSRYLLIVIGTAIFMGLLMFAMMFIFMQH